MDCKDFRKMIDEFDRQELDIDLMSDFVEHVSDCGDCQEEYEIYLIMKYAIQEDDEKTERELAGKSAEERNLINSYDFKSLVKYRIKQSANRLDRIKRNEYYNKCLFAIAEFSVMLMAVFYMFGSIFM